MSDVQPYLIHCIDKPNTAELRTRNLVHHRAYLASQPHRILMAGPRLAEDRSCSLGSFIVIEAASLQEAFAFNRQDPFFALGLWETIDIHPFVVEMHA
jgi:uncharacterized protein YciI